MIAISSFIAERIKHYYGRSVEVIHPPVNTTRFAGRKRSVGDYYLLVSALVPYKNVELAMDAFATLDRKLVVAGGGPLLGKLKAKATKNVDVLGWVGDAELTELVAGCRAFIFPQVEDFGIAPVEAMSAGRPVIAFAAGGALDIIADVDRVLAKPAPDLALPRGGADLEPIAGKLPTGLFFYEQSPADLASAILRFETIESQFDPRAIALWATQFGETPFRQKILRWLSDVQPTIVRQAA